MLVLIIQSKTMDLRTCIWLNSKRGDVVSLHSVDEHGRRLIAHAWNEPGKASANVN